MKRKVISLILVCVMLLSLCGCGGTVGEIASNVADAAMKELEIQVKKTLEENKLKVVEMKTEVGQLNEKSKYQFFTAALVQSDSMSIPQATADTLAKLFTEAGLVVQTGSKVESPYLVYKEIEFKHTDFSAGNYFVIYAYHEDLAANLPNINADATSST